jgi:NADPH:quinone reductase
MHAIMVNAFGGPDTFAVTDVERPSPGPGQILVEVAVSGVNFLDVYQRTGASPLQAPYSAGIEGVGTVVELGDATEGFQPGQRVGWFSGGQGSFADYTVVQASKAVPVPDTVDDDTAVASLLQGVTAQYLATDAYRIQAGDIILVHAAAGGVGQMLTQVAKLRGATVIGTTSTEAKARVARDVGVDHAVLYREFVDAVRDITDGSGVVAAYDGVGRTTFDGSLASLAVRGTLVIYGTASGPTPSLDVQRLNTGGSLYVTRPTVDHYTRTPEELRDRAAEVFRWIAEGTLKVNVGARYPVALVGEAFAALESRRTTGKVLLTHDRTIAAQPESVGPVRDQRSDI